MSEFSPDTHIVRTRYATYGNIPDELWETAIAVHGPEFDRWLEAHDREVAAKSKAGLLREITLVASTRGGTNASIVNRILEILDETL